MAAVRKHRECLIAAAIGLFRRQGYAGTGLAEILAESGAPRGSLYHYFPDGKAEIAEAALRVAGEHMTGIMHGIACASASPGELVARYGAGLAASLEKSGFRDGCAVATVVLEAAPGSPKLAAAGRDAFGAWSDVVTGMLERAGIGSARARQLADFTIAAFEGAMILARARSSAVPVLAAAEELRRLFDSELKRIKETV
jgi:TetR/AcrR family transcriptional repressor of lmrAB and yxaGH operons